MGDLGIVRWKRVALYAGLAMVVAHGASLTVVALGGSWRTTDWVWIAQLVMLAPALVAIGLQKLVYKEPLREPLAIRFRPNRWFLVAWLLPVVLAFATLGLSLLLPGIEYRPDMEGVLDRHVMTEEQLAGGFAVCEALGIHPLVLFALTGLTLGPTFSLVGGLGEEIGWRGFLYRECEPLGFWRSCLVIGLIWGLWHVPQIFLGHLDHESPWIGAGLFVVMVVLYTPIFNYIRMRSGSSVAAALFHGSGNASMMIAIAPVQGGSALTVGIGSATFCALLVVVNVAIVLLDPSVRRGRRAAGSTKTR